MLSFPKAFLAYFLVTVAYANGTSLHYQLVAGAQHALCRDVGKALDSEEMVRSPSERCKWRFGPTKSLARSEIRFPNWKPVGQEKFDLISKLTWERSLDSKIGADSREELWRSTFRSQFSRLMSSGLLHFYAATFDLDGDGKQENVILEDRTDCGADEQTTRSPLVHVVDEGSSRLDPRYDGSSDFVRTPFFYDGKIRFIYFDIAPSGVLAPKNGRIPIASVKVVESRSPGSHNSFQYTLPICSFNVFQ